jgi:hypothetical protein
MRHMQYVSIVIGIFCLLVILVNMQEQLQRIEQLAFNIYVRQHEARILATPPTVIGSMTWEYTHPIYRVPAEKPIKDSAQGGREE